MVNEGNEESEKSENSLTDQQIKTTDAMVLQLRS